MYEKRTKGPWRATGPTGPQMKSYSQPYGIAVSGKAVLIAGCFGDIDGGDEAAKENAEFIVRACNAHELLVNALQRIAAGDVTNSQFAVLAKAEAREALEFMEGK